MVAQPMGFRIRFHAFTLLLLSCVCFAALIGCGGKKRVKLPPPTPARVGWTQQGIASWYGHPYHGRRTSGGEVYDMDKLTAAHLSLPFGTWVRVTNLANNNSVEVKINDRGPFVKRRIIDLSREGAKRIGMIGPGTARVRVRVVATPSMAYKRRKPAVAAAQSRSPAPAEPPAPLEPVPEPAPQHPQTADTATESHGGNAEKPCSFYGVQVGSFQDIENAERMQGKIARQYGTARVVERQGDERQGDKRQSDLGTLYRVVAGRFTAREHAGDLQRRLRQDDIDGFVTAFTLDNPSDCL